MKSLKAFVPGLVLISLLAFVACERLEPAAQPKVLLQASGTVGDQDATLQLRAMDGGLAIVAREKLSQQPLIAGFVPATSLSELMKGVRGPLQSNFSGSTLRVMQEGKIEMGVTVVAGPQAGSATQGIFQFEGSRYIRYNAGLLEHGLEGRVHLVLKAADGAVTARFDGATTQEGAQNHRRSMNPERVAVATRLSGEVTGAYFLGGAVVGNHQAKFSIDLAHGAGAVEMSSMKQIFDFNPATDLTPPGGSGKVELVARTSEYVELSDTFQAHVSNSHVHLEKGQVAVASADIQYDIRLAITSDKVLTVGTASMSASVETQDGKKAEFHGSDNHLQTELDW